MLIIKALGNYKKRYTPMPTRITNNISAS